MTLSLIWWDYIMLLIEIIVIALLVKVTVRHQHIGFLSEFMVVSQELLQSIGHLFVIVDIVYLLQVLNKIDLPGADPDRVAKEIEEVSSEKLSAPISVSLVLI